MPRHKWETVSPDNILKKISEAGFSETNRLNTTNNETIGIDKIDKRIADIISIIQDPNRKKKDMIFFVMYDIESNKVRNLVAKYLIAQGCIRIQNSIFIADAPQERCTSIKNDLKAVQAAYDNNDSIIVCPINADNIAAMHIIGKEIDLDLVTKGKNSLFF